MRIQKLFVPAAVVTGIMLVGLLTATGAHAQTCDSLTTPQALVTACDGKTELDDCCLNTDACRFGKCGRDAPSEDLTCQLFDFGPPIQCIDGDAATCTSGVCDGGDPQNDVPSRCQSVANDTRCTADTNECTDAICSPDDPGADPTTGCTNVNDDTNTCTDNATCTTNTCNAGVCDATPDSTQCPDDANDCTDALCDPNAQGANPTTGCTNVNDDTNTCTDSATCTTNACNAGVCDATPDSTQCPDDANDCTDALCDPNAQGANPTTGCANVNDDTNTCTDSATCTTNACNAGVCDATPDSTQCPDDANDCTDALCDPNAQGANPTTGCANVNDDTNTCTDSATCTTNACNAGVCDATPDDTVCTDNGLNVCSVPTCDPADPDSDPETGCAPGTGDTNGDPCDDGDVCTLLDECLDGVCQPGIDHDCSDFNTPCSTATCDSRFVELNCEGAPIPLEDGTPCDDGTTCTPIDVCQDGECVGVGCGDPTRDGKKNLGDCLAIVYSALIHQGDCPLDACDLNGNCRVDITDALGCLHCAVGLESCAWFQKCPIPIGFPIYETTSGEPDTQTSYTDFLAGINYSKAPGEFCSLGYGKGGGIPRLAETTSAAVAPGGELICETLVNPDNGCRPQGAYPDDGETVLPTVTNAFCGPEDTFHGPTLARCFFLQEELAQMDVCNPEFDMPAAFQVLDAEGFSLPTVTLPEVTVCPVAGPRCGNRICDPLYEGRVSCSSECSCGDGLCDLEENFDTCALDCLIATCGDGTCDSPEEEVDCPFDCSSNQPSSTPPCVTPPD